MITQEQQGEHLHDDLSAITAPTTTTNNVRTTDTIGDRMTRRQRLNAIISSVRRIKSQQRVTPPSTHTPSCRAQLDTHADTCAVGDTAYILEYTERVVDVAPYSDEYQPMAEIPIVKAAFAYDDPVTGETFILVVGQALYFGSKLPYALLNPNQIRANGIDVDDVPHHLARNGNSTHSIYFPEENVRIPLDLKGCISGFNVRRPSIEEIHTCTMLTVTSHDIEWDPRSPMFQQREEAYEINENEIILPIDPQNRTIYSMQTDMCQNEHLDPTDLSSKVYHHLEAMSIMASFTKNNRL
jgi:hypothetical protein